MVALWHPASDLWPYLCSPARFWMSLMATELQFPPSDAAVARRVTPPLPCCSRLHHPALPCHPSPWATWLLTLTQVSAPLLCLLLVAPCPHSQCDSAWPLPPVSQMHWATECCPAHRRSPWVVPLTPPSCSCRPPPAPTTASPSRGSPPKAVRGCASLRMACESTSPTTPCVCKLYLHCTARLILYKVQIWLIVYLKP